jgi:hypothetical protein
MLPKNRCPALAIEKKYGMNLKNKGAKKGLTLKFYGFSIKK